MNFKILSWCLVIVAASVSASPKKVSLDEAGAEILRKIGVKPRIVGGSDAGVRQLPYQASIRLKVIDDLIFGLGHYCGGSLITQRAVLTAGHCLRYQEGYDIGASEIRVVGGNVNVLDNGASTHVSDARKIIIHEQFNLNTLSFDIGIILLKTEVLAEDNWFTPIPLASLDTPTGTSCVVSGWGALEYEGSSPVRLQVAHVEIYNYAQCQASYGVLPVNTICAGVQGGLIDACQGDSGGALVCNGLQTGIVSGGFECARPGFPTVYTDITKYRHWIADNGSIAGARVSGLMLIVAAVLAVIRW